MKRLSGLFACVMLVGALAGSVAPARAAGAPAVTSLSADTLSRSGRLLVSGSGFGAAQGTSLVLIGGLAASVTRWSDSLIVAYVPEATPVGAANVQVIVGGAASNGVPLSVTLRQASGRVRWRFQVDAQYGYLLQRPAVGPDGTVVAHDPAGNVYALSADGGLKWIFKTPGSAASPPSIGADGTVYVASGSTIYSLAANGKLKWTFTEPPGGQGVIIGPTVGPDGNIYAVTDFAGLGALALSPAGQLLWSNLGNPTFLEMAQIGAEVVFGPSRAGGAIDQLYAGVNEGLPAGGVLHALTLGGSERWAVLAGGWDGAMQGQRQPAVGPDGTVYMTAAGIYSDPCNGSCLYSFDPVSGAAKWFYSPWPANGMSEPTVGSDGTIYVGRSLAYLDAVTPAGKSKWTIFDGGVLAHPTVNPQNTLLVAGDAPNYGQPGSVRAFSAANGQMLWDLGLPSENGGYQVLYSRPRFAPDGQTVYFGTDISAPTSPDQYTYLYAVDTSGTAPPSAAVTLASLTVSPTQVRAGSAATGTILLSAAAPPQGIVVTLSSGKAKLAAVPPSVTIAAGSAAATFTITTNKVSRTTSVSITASYASVKKTAQLVVTP